MDTNVKIKSKLAKSASRIWFILFISHMIEIINGKLGDKRLFSQINNT